MNERGLIYAFVDLNGDYFYIGRTIDLKTRARSHAYAIKYNKLKSPKYDKMRKIMIENNITIDTKNMISYMEIIEDDIHIDELNDKEIFYIKHYRIIFGLLNLTDGGDGMLNPSKELRKKQSDIRRGVKRSQETKDRISKAKKGVPLTEAHKKSLSKAWQKRIPMSEESHKKRSETSTGKINIKKYKITDPHGNIFFTENGLSQFCKEHDLTQQLMSKVANGSRKHHKGWLCEIIHY